jgi:chitin synthase
MNLSIHTQKYLIIVFLFSINTITITTFITYIKNWYIYLFILSLATIINCSSALLLIFNKIFSKETDIQFRNKPFNYIYIIPCYNESEEELTLSIKSIVCQHTLPRDYRCMLIICDGKVKGNGNIHTTDVILMKILNQLNEPLIYEYITWDNEKNRIELYSGIYECGQYIIEYLLIIKNKNYGKRDSLVLARKLCYNYNMKIISDNMVNSDMMTYIGGTLNEIYSGSNIDFIIGIDADTIFDYNCSYELIKVMENDESVHGCVGYVDIYPKMNSFSIYILYQYAEYMFAQCLRRQAQSHITSKVSCLSGCNQILRVSNETCGEEILTKFNYLPKEDENIFNHIRSYASEDRNHVCLMLSMFPNVKTKQTLKAIAYTVVPTSIKVFMSQRRRWSLGANTNDMLLIYLPGINIFERISALVNIITYSFSPFIFVATVFFIKSIIIHPSYLMLLLSIPILIVAGYSILIPIFIKPLSFRSTLYYYLSYIFFVIFGSLINLFLYFNSIINMDVIKWGKTRSIGTGNETIININRKLYTQDDNEHVQELEYDDFIYSIASAKDEIVNSTVDINV